jgi:PAS domain S-box-containing protein
VTLRILFVEDSQDDVELQLRRLRDAGIDPQWDRVQTEDALRSALAGESWQIALVDYNIPGFSGIEALRLIAEEAPDVPAITVSGAIDEDTAVATISAGAVDYVLKDNLTRLAPAVRRAVDGADLRRAHRRAAEAARLALFAVDNASLSIATVAEDGTVVYANDQACRDFFMDREALIGSKLWDVDEQMQPEVWRGVWARAVAEGALEFRMARDQPDGSHIVLDTTVNYLAGADLLITYGRDITRRMMAEEQARESQALYRRIVEMAGEGIWARDAEHRTTFVNAQMAAMLGLTPSDMLGRLATDFVFEEDLEQYREEMDLRERQESGSYRGRLRRADGGETWVEVSSVPDVEADGGVGSFGMFTDITERRLADEALSAERANLAAIFESSPVAMLVFDARANVVRLNRAALRLSGRDAERLLEHRADSEVQCGDVLGCAQHHKAENGCGTAPECPLCPLRNAVAAVLDAAVNMRGVEFSMETLRDGAPEEVWLRIGAEPMVMDGAPHVTVAVEDITDRRRAEMSLAESEERYRAMFEKNRAVKLLIEPETGAIVDANPAAADFYGYSPDRFRRLNIADLNTLPADELDAALAQAVGSQVTTFLFQHRLASGNLRDVEVNTGPVDVGGRTLLYSIVHDVTERVRAESALRESEARFRSLAERVPGFVTIKDADSRYVYLSSLWGALDETGETAWLGKLPEEVWPAEAAATSNRSAQEALAGGMVDEVTTMRKGDEEKFFHSLHFPIPLDGAPPLVGGLMIDVTDQVKAQEEVRRQAEQLRRTVEGAVLAMSQVVETRDPYTAGHERRVAELATAIGSDLGLDPAVLNGLRLGSLIHDIGKISVPAEILAKPGRLSTVEFNLIKQHPRAGYEILSVIDFGRPVAEMVLQHHERLDGSGYPQGLTEHELLPETRVLAVADVVEAMSSHRPYRAALGRDAALQEIREGSGTRYDPVVVAACERVMVDEGFRFSP